MRSAILVALAMSCILAFVTSVEVDCPENWEYKCTAPLDYLKVKKPSKYCKDIGGYSANSYCHIEPGQLISANGCCENGK